MNVFDIDLQTLNDLEIFTTRSNRKSLFKIFNKTCTNEGELVLNHFFKNPLTNIFVITERKELISYLSHNYLEFKLDREAIDFIEFYLKQHISKKKPTIFYKAQNSFIDYLSPSRELYVRRRGVKEVLNLITYLQNILDSLKLSDEHPLLNRTNDTLQGLKNNKHISEYFLKRKDKLTYAKLYTFDFELRKTEIKKIKELLELTYELDAYFAVVKTAKAYSLVFPTVSDDADKCIAIKGLTHIFLDNPIPNDIYINSDKNISFITGVNMAGKSTFLKSIAMAVYLSHLGFPVPAKEMKTSIFQGVITTINMADNLSEGYSHYYNEVLRVKVVAEKVAQSKNMLIIFDELFRGTNVKDAHEASVSIIDSFSKIKNCLFLISTHIFEVAEDLKLNPNIDFNFLESNIIEGTPNYTHKLKSGITNERMGLWIIKNEGILEILNKSANR